MSSSLKVLKNIQKLPVELKTPIEIENVFQKVSVLGAGSGAAYREQIQELLHKQEEYIVNEMHKKLHLFADHLKVNLKSKDGWREMAEVMALSYFEGFTVREKVAIGPKKKWDSLTLFRLYYEVYLKGKETENNVLHACRLLAKKQPWKSILLTSDPQKAASSLNKQYQKALLDPIVSSLKLIVDTGSDSAREQIHKVYELICDGELTSFPKQ